MGVDQAKLFAFKNMVSDKQREIEIALKSTEIDLKKEPIILREN